MSLLDRILERLICPACLRFRGNPAHWMFCPIDTTELDEDDHSW